MFAYYLLDATGVWWRVAPGVCEFIGPDWFVSRKPATVRAWEDRDERVQQELSERGARVPLHGGVYEPFAPLRRAASEPGPPPAGDYTDAPPTHPLEPAGTE